MPGHPGFFPNFFIVGAPRCGTTSLSKYLKWHPQVRLSDPKETHFFTSIYPDHPELDIQRVRTTVPMPDGGTVMLGGLKISDKQEQRSGVPILDRIPVVRFLFERQGSYVANSKLLILINANIVIPDELAPTPSQLGM